MEITDMILVTENWKGNESNFLVTCQDYLLLIGAEDFDTMSELADVMVELGRTLGKRDAWQETYVASNKTISARYCTDEKQLGQFLQGHYNNKEQKWRFDEVACSAACLEKLETIGMDTKGWNTSEGMHYKKLDSHFEQGQIIHNFNNHDYRVLECLSERNLLVMDVNSGSFTIAIGANMYARHPSGKAPNEINSIIGVEWDHGIYLAATPSEIDFRQIRQEYGTRKMIEDVYDYRSYLRSQFRMFHALSQDELATDAIKSAAVDAMYEEFGTGREDVFEDRLEDGKYDAGFTHEYSQQRKRAM